MYFFGNIKSTITWWIHFQMSSFFDFLGADIIITYFVPQLLDWLNENWGSAGQMENR